MPPEGFIAVDLGATNVRVAFFNGNNRMVGNIIEKTVPEIDGEQIPIQLKRMIKKLISRHARYKVLGIGVCSMGPLDTRQGVIVNTPNVLYKGVIPIIKPLLLEFNVPAVLLNDCNAGVLGEKTFGVYKDLDTLFYLTISSGIGGGVYTNGKVLEGRGNAAEVGHFFVSDRYENKCGCGGVGHWEGLASGNNIPGFFEEWLNGHRDDKLYREFSFFFQKEQKEIDLLAVMAMKSAEEIFKVINDYRVGKIFLLDLGIIHARGFSQIIKAYDPEIILVGGSVALNHWDLLFGSLEIESTLLSPPPIVKATLGADAPLMGALAAIQEYYRNR